MGPQGEGQPKAAPLEDAQSEDAQSEDVVPSAESSGPARQDGWGPVAGLSSRTRWMLAALMAVLAATALAAALVSVWADRVLLNEDRFSAHLASTLREDEMNRYLAGEITEQVLARAPELLAFRPAVEAVLSEALRTRTASTAARAALRAAHRNVTSGVAEDSIIIDLQAVFTLASALMQRVAPDVAERFQAGLDTTRIDASAVGLRTGLFDGLDRLTGFRWPLLGLAALLGVGAVAVAPSRRGGALLAIGALTFAAGAGLVAQPLAEAWLAARLPGGEGAREAVTLAWRSLLREYRGWNLGLLALGLAGVAGVLAAGRLPDRMAVRRFFARSFWGRTIAGGALAVAGLALARWPLDAIRVIVIAAGLVLAGGGMLLLLRNALARVQELRPGERVRSARLLLAAYALLAALAIVSAVAFWYEGTPEVEPSPVAPVRIAACNGSALLCDVPLDQVVFPATHNSMAAASERGWFYPTQRYGIPRQLQDGVRALLIDTYYGIPSPQGVLTVGYDMRRAELVARHGEEVVAAAERIAGRLRADGQREIFLCHSFCELGATPLAAALVDIRDYLNASPGEFLILILQDYTSPEDTIREFERADLASRAYAHPTGDPWPTLGELLADGKQLLVLAERQGGGADWYESAYDTATAEGFLGATALDTRTLDDFACTIGRGATDHPLLLMNHWVTGRSPLPSQALEVNAAEVLLGRAEDCTPEWGRVPNIVAVDFYDVGDLFMAVDALNGVQEPEPSPAPGATLAP